VLGIEYKALNDTMVDMAEAMIKMKLIENKSAAI